MRETPCRWLAKFCAKLLADGVAKFARSSESKFQETIVSRVIRVTHVPLRHLQSAKLCKMGLCAPCRGAPAVVLRFSCQRSNWAYSFATLQVRKHTFKASVACNGREVLRGTPGRRHGISAIEAADCLGNREPTMHWKVSRTSAACRVGSRKHLSPSAMRSEPVGPDWRLGSTFASPPITCPLKS